MVRQESTTVDGNGKVVHTVTSSRYDSHNRLAQVTVTDLTDGTVMLEESYRYDAAGNRREVQASSDGTTTDAWYSYDGDNRVVLSTVHATFLFVG